MKKRSSSIALAGISLLFSTTATSNEELPESFSEYGWLLDGVREVISRNTEFAPVTTCYDLNRMFTGEMTSSIQKERAWEDYEGKLIPLTGIVEEVKRIPITNDYLAFFKCTNSESFIVDFTVEIPEEMEEYAFDLTPGDRRNMYVRLTDYGEMMGVSTELDTFEVDIGNGKNCFSYLDMMSRNPDEYEYKCYNMENRTGFGNLIAKSGESQQIASILKNDDKTIMFFSFPEHPESYISQININEERILHFSGNDNICEISSTYLKENQLWAKDTFREIGEQILSTENEGLAINDWYVERNSYISGITGNNYTCKQDQSLRLLVYIGYLKAKNKNGLQDISKKIESEINE